MINTIRQEAFKEAHVYPPLDELVVSKVYAFTINPQVQFKSFTETYLHQTESIYKILQPNSQYCLRPEISTKTTRLHYHGTIRFKSALNIVAFYFHTIPLLKEFATFTIKEITDYEWYLYCVKSRHLMKPYLNAQKLPYKITHDLKPLKITFNKDLDI